MRQFELPEIELKKFYIEEIITASTGDGDVDEGTGGENEFPIV